MRNRTVTVVVVLTVCGLGGVVALAATSGASVASPAVEANAKAEVQNLAAPSSSETTTIYAQAIRAAEVAGDPQPTSVEMTVASMGSATALMESSQGPSTNSLVDPRTGEPWNDSAVYMVAMHGDFRMSSVAVPKGHKVPSGTWLTLLIDRQLDKIVGVHVSDEGENLHALGTVTAWGN